MFVGATLTFQDQMTVSEALLGVMGNREIMSFISGEQWTTSKKKKKNEGNGGTNVILGSREHRNLRF